MTPLSSTRARRGLLAVASSGLAITIAASSAAAAPGTSTRPAQPNTGAVSISEDAADVLTTSPGMTIPGDAYETGPRAEAHFSPAAPVTEQVAETPALGAPAPSENLSTEPAAEAPAAEAPAAEPAAETAEPAAETAAEPAADVAPAAAPSAVGSSVVATAYNYTGIPYAWGQSNPAVGFDCAGFVSFVFAQHGISVPHSTTGQLNAGRIVSAAEARPGDIVYSPGHTAIYIGNGQVIGAWNPGMPSGTGPISWYTNSPTFVRVG
ncbi:cell wall-associated NlpC family hydrolase [Bogoriella caseilytica]|uniref:Cell wall-associated NlpC family hydrolase n=1 Tax=Bogoriella caseilytica TaxID=56055 RepID=A0A3N2BD66_9MICO|nr:cell wall-associated NlpC family hydrolase [Bogoriella caseilytica]